MIKTNKKIFIAVLKYASALFLILIPIVAIYGVLVPWQPIEGELAKYPDSIAILVGISGEYRGDYEKVTKTYLLFNPKDLKSLSISLTIDSKGLHELSIKEGSLIAMLIHYSFFIFCTYWFWFKKTSNKLNQQDASDSDVSA